MRAQLNRIALCLALAGCAPSAAPRCPKPSPVAASPASAPPPEGETLRNASFAPVSRCLVIGLGATPDDVAIEQAWLEQGAAAVHAYFAAQGGAALFDDVTCIVAFWGAPGAKASDGESLSEGVRQGRAKLTILHFLALSAQDPNGRTLLGEPRNESSQRRNIVHEYCGIYLDQVTRKKASGWRLYSAPSWFYQGYEEYLAATLSSEHARTVTLDATLKKSCESPSRVRPAFESVENVYVDGTALLLFLHEEFGADRVRAVLTNSAPEFWLAVRAELGLDAAGLYERWEAWRKRRCPAPGPAGGG